MRITCPFSSTLTVLPRHPAMSTTLFFIKATTSSSRWSILNFARSGLKVTLVQFSPPLHFVITGSDFFPMLLEKTFQPQSENSISNTHRNYHIQLQIPISTQKIKFSIPKTLHSDLSQIITKPGAESYIHKFISNSSKWRKNKLQIQLLPSAWDLSIPKNKPAKNT